MKPFHARLARIGLKAGAAALVALLGVADAAGPGDRSQAGPLVLLAVVVLAGAGLVGLARWRKWQVNRLAYRLAVRWWNTTRWCDRCSLAVLPDANM